MNKCKAIHTVVKNSNYSYNLMGSKLVVTGEERDLEVMIKNSMKMLSQYCKKKKTNSVLVFQKP